MVSLLWLFCLAVLAAAQGPPPGISIPTDGATGPPPNLDFLTPPGTNLADDRGPALIAISVLGVVVSGFFVALRLYRTVQIKKFRGDDHLIVVAMLFHLATVAITIASVHYGEGKHIAAITNLDYRTKAMKLSIITQFIGSFAIVFAKISVGATLLQLKLGRTFDVLVVICLFIATVGNFFASIVVFAGCRTRYLFYTGRDLPCLGVETFGPSTIFRAAGNVLVDTVFVLAPMWFLRKIKLTPRDRLAMNLLLSFIFTYVLCEGCTSNLLTDLSATVFAIANAVKVRDSLRNGIDMTWNTALVVCFQIAEVSLCIMAASLPSIRHMLGRRFPKQWRFWHTNSSSSGSSNPSKNSITKTITSTFRRSANQPQLQPPHFSNSLRDSADPSNMAGHHHQRSGSQIPLTSIFDYERHNAYRDSSRPRPLARIDYRLSEPFSPVSPTKVEFANDHRDPLPNDEPDGEKGWPLQDEEEKGIISANEREGSSSDEWTISPGSYQGHAWERQCMAEVDGSASCQCFPSQHTAGTRHGVAELEARNGEERRNFPDRNYADHYWGPRHM